MHDARVEQYRAREMRLRAGWTQVDVYRGGKLRKMKPTSISAPQLGLAVPILIEAPHVAAILNNHVIEPVTISRG